MVSKNRNASTTSNDDGNGNSLTILDVHTDPASPSVVGTVQSPTQLFGAYGIAVSGQYAYVAYQGLLGGQPKAPDTSTGGLSVIDISSPGSPAIVANLDNGSLPAPWTGQNLFDHSTSVAVSGHFAYVTAFSSARLTAIDISNPTSPQIVGSVRDAFNMALPADIAIQGNDAYIADQTGGTSAQLTVVDLSDPAALRVVGTLSQASLNGAYRIHVRGSFAYLSARDASAVAAIDISNPASPRLADVVSDASRLNRTTGLDLDPTGGYVVASSPYLVSESNQTFPPYPQQSGGPSNTGTISVIALDPTPIAVSLDSSSEPASLTAQTSAAFAFAPSDVIATVQCSLDGAPLGPCTTATAANYSGLRVGTHSFTVQATDAAGRTAAASYGWTVGVAPFNQASPRISGRAVQGRTLTSTTGNFIGTPSPSYSYQWQRCNTSGASCASITGATGARYTLVAADIKHRLRVIATARNGLGGASGTSAVSSVVAPAVAITAQVTGVRVGRPHLRISARVANGSPPVSRIADSLPAGLHFAPLAALRRALKVVDGNGHRVAFRATLRKGVLTIDLRRAGRALTVTAGPSGLTLSSRLRSRVKHQYVTTGTVGVLVRDAIGHLTRDAIRLKLSLGH